MKHGISKKYKGLKVHLCMHPITKWVWELDHYSLITILQYDNVTFELIDTLKPKMKLRNLSYLSLVATVPTHHVHSIVRHILKN